MITERLGRLLRGREEDIYTERTSIWRLVLVIAVLFFGIYAFMFRDIIFNLPQLMSGEVVINGDELVPFFNPHSQFLDQVKGEFNDLTNGYEFRVRYSVLTTWVRYYKVLPFALLTVIPAMALLTYLSVAGFLSSVLPGISRRAAFRVTPWPILFIFLIMTYAKVTHFYTLVFGFALFVIAIVAMGYGMVFAKRWPYLYMAAGCLVTTINPAVHYLVLFALFMGLLLVGVVFIELIEFARTYGLKRWLRPSTWRELWGRRGELPRPLVRSGLRWAWANRTRILHAPLVKSSAAFVLLGVLTIAPYGIFVKFFVLNGITNLSETVPVNYYFVEDASVPFLHLMSFDLAGISDKLMTGNYLAPHPRITNIVYTVAMFLPLFNGRIRRSLLGTKERRSFFIVAYGIMLFSMWASLGYSGPSYLPTFHRTIAFITNVANSTQTTIGDLVVKLAGTIIQVLRFPHRFQLMVLAMASILLPMAMIYIEAWYREKIMASRYATYRRRLHPFFVILFFLPMMVNWEYYETFTSGNFGGFLQPYPVGPLKEVKDFLKELPEGKVIVLPPTESAKTIVDIDGNEHKFIDKFHIYYLDLPSFYYGLTGDARNKQEFFLMLRAMQYGQEWWVNIARDNFVRYIVVNKELQANSDGGAEYLKEMEKKLIPLLDASDEYTRKIFENESYSVYEFIDLPAAQRIPLYIDTDWNSFIKLLNSDPGLTRYYDLRYSMVVGDLEDYDNLTVVTADEQNTAIDLYLKSHPTQSFAPASTTFPFNPAIVPSSHYFSPVFRLFQFFSDSKWNRLNIITPGLYGSATGSFIGVPKATTFRIDVKIPEDGTYRLLMSGVSTANDVTVTAKGTDYVRKLAMSPADSQVVFFSDDEVFTNHRTPIDMSTYSIKEMEELVPGQIVPVNYRFRWIDMGTIEAKAGTYKLYFDKTDNNPLLVENVLVMPEAEYQTLQLPQNTTVLDRKDTICCTPLETHFADEVPGGGT